MYFLNASCIYRFDVGVAPPSSTFQIDDKNKIAVDLAKHFIIYSSKAELDQFQSGLETLDTLNFMKKHAVTIKSLFAQRATELTAQAMLTLFEINWSQSGTTARGIEEAVIVAWSEYVLNMNGTATTEM